MEFIFFSILSMMRKHLFVLLFFTAFVPLVLAVPRKYYLIQQGKTWSDAQTYCRATHKDLATIETSDEMIKLKNVAQSQSFIFDAWIGLYFDKLSWRWSIGNETVGPPTFWCISEPNNWAGWENCSVTTTACWVDYLCSVLWPFVCFDDRLTGSDRYIYVPTYVTWFDAQTYCRTFHTDLASARDATEYSIVRGKIGANSWIGLNRDSWKWSDKTNISSVNWMPGQPDNYGQPLNCASVLNGQAYDFTCTDIKSFFCYRIITGQQRIIKLQVQSGEDVNSQVIKDAILEKIKQMLIEFGLQSNIIVKWREQPGGSVFYKKMK